MHQVHTNKIKNHPCLYTGFKNQVEKQHPTTKKKKEKKKKGKKMGQSEGDCNVRLKLGEWNRSPHDGR
jgi:hypothetical protein